MRHIRPVRLFSASVAVLACFFLCVGPSYSDVTDSFCPGGGCQVSNPNYVVVYWAPSFAAWDSAVQAASLPEFTHERVDTLLRAVFQTDYFFALRQYGVTGPTLSQSQFLGICAQMAPVPVTTTEAQGNVGNLALCLSRLLNLGQDAIFVVLMPPGTLATDDFGGCSPLARHGQYPAVFPIVYPPSFPVLLPGYPGAPYFNVAFIPTTCANSTLNSSGAAALVAMMTHEMVEAATDPNPSGLSGWRTNPFGSEIGDDLCNPQTSPVLYGTVQNYWSNFSNDKLGISCVAVTKQPTQIVTTSVCGTGRAMRITATGTFAPRPWDLPPASIPPNFGTQPNNDRSLYAKLSVAKSSGGQWEAGNAIGLPNSAGNNGTGDLVFFASLQWVLGTNGQPDTLTISGFDSGYGSVVNTTPATVGPGDTLALSVASSIDGQWPTPPTILTAPRGAAFTNVSILPPGQQSIIVGHNATLSGYDHDQGGCIVENELISVAATAGQVTPPALSDQLGYFASTYTAPPTAGPQTITVSIPQTPVTLSLAVPVAADVSSIVPVGGNVVGGNAAIVLGSGFVPAATSAKVVSKSQFPATTASSSVLFVDATSVLLTIPPSPLSAGDGITCVAVTSNNVESECLDYRYVIPGKPEITYTPTSCTTGEALATVFGTDGAIPHQQINFTGGPGTSFRPVAGGQFSPMITVPSGTSVFVSGSGPITATNVQLPALSQTVSLPSPSLQLCNLAINRAFIDTKGSTWTVEHLKPLPVPPCRGPECLDGGEAGYTLWRSELRGRPSPSVVIAGPMYQFGQTISVRVPSTLELGALVAANPYIVTLAKQRQGALEVLGPAVVVDLSSGRVGVVEKLGRQGRLVIPLPLAVRPTDFSIVHLTSFGATHAWVEEPGVAIGPKGASLNAPLRESGVYALARIVTTGKKPLSEVDSPK